MPRQVLRGVEMIELIFWQKKPVDRSIHKAMAAALDIANGRCIYARNAPNPDGTADQKTRLVVEFPVLRLTA